MTFFFLDQSFYSLCPNLYVCLSFLVGPKRKHFYIKQQFNFRIPIYLFFFLFLNFVLSQTTSYKVGWRESGVLFFFLILSLGPLLSTGLSTTKSIRQDLVIEHKLKRSITFLVIVQLFSVLPLHSDPCALCRSTC